MDTLGSTSVEETTSTAKTVVRAFAPASVSNVGCGFDVLGFAIEGAGDVVEARRREEPGVGLLEITGDDGRLPLDPARNTATVAARSLLERAGSNAGVALTVHKQMPLSSGLGSSAASAVAAAVAVDELMGFGSSQSELLTCALAGEEVSSGSAHADNASASLYGGFVLIRPADPPDVVQLPVPEGLTCALVRPHIEIETRASRGLLGDTVRLKDAVQQWGNLAALTIGLFRSDFELISRALVDVIAEPRRSKLVPGFSAVQQVAVEAGALGCSLSGSGPSIFALCVSPQVAERVGEAMQAALGVAGLAADVYTSPVGIPGARPISQAPGATTFSSPRELATS